MKMCRLTFKVMLKSKAKEVLFKMVVEQAVEDHRRLNNTIEIRNAVSFPLLFNHLN